MTKCRFSEYTNYEWRYRGPTRISSFPKHILDFIGAALNAVPVI